ncbi:MAG: hypothetical protein JW990_19585 [Thermoleophilia bacterium]|nr:hypothetical protein [Thermoleophilia bacterium]
MAGLGSAGRCLKRRAVVCAALLVGLVGALVCLTLLGAAGSAGARVEPSTWAKSYVGDDVMARGVFGLPDGDLIMTGLTTGRPQVTRLSAEGDVRWARRYDWPGTGVHGVPSSDLGPIGIPCLPSGMLVFWGDLLFRLDDDGDVVWGRRYHVSVPASSGSIEFADAVQLPDGGLAVCGHRGYDRVFVCRMDSGGAPLWTRLYELKPSGRSRIFALAGGDFLLGGTTLPEDGIPDTYGCKLMWLTADGEVQRAQSYVDTTRPDSSYGHLMNMALTSTGPALCQYRYSDGCGGTNVIKLDSAGAVRWTTWVGGTRRGEVTVSAGYIDAAADGGLALVGSTTEFSEHALTRLDGLAEKLSADGDVQWISTLDRGLWFDSEGVAAMDDGGLVWAANATPEVETEVVPLLIRMGAGGSAGKLGGYLTQVDVGNERLVRIEHPEMSSQVASRGSQSATCEAEDLRATSEDMTLTGSDVEGEALAVLTLEPLYPSDPDTPSTIMPGGTLYRYYRVLDGNGTPVPDAEIRYFGPFSSTKSTATSDATGEVVFKFKVPRSADPQYVNSTLTIDRVRVEGRRSSLAAAPDFATDVLPLSWSTSWMMGSGVGAKAGLGAGGGVFVEGQQTAGMVVTRTEADAANDGRGSFAIGDLLTTEAALGVQAEMEGKLRLGTAEAKGPSASVKATLGTFLDFATLYDEPSECSNSEKLMAALTLLVGVEHCASGGLTTLLSVAQGAIVSALSGDVEMEHLTGGVSFGISGNATVASLELMKKDQPGPGATGTKSLSGVSFGNLSAGEKTSLAITAYPGSGELSGAAGYEFGTSLSAAQALGYDVGGWSAVGALLAELVVDPLDTSFERLVLTAGAVPDDNGESQETRLIVDGSVVGAAGEAILEQLEPLIPGVEMQPDRRIVIAKEAYGQIVQSVVAELASAPIRYEHVVTMDKAPTSLDVGLGVSIAGTGFDLAVRPTWGRYNSFPLERGLFVVIDHQQELGRMVMLEEYPASLFSARVDTLPDVVAELLSVVGDLLSEAWEMVTGTLSSAGSTLLSVGAGMGGAVSGGATALFQAGTSVLAAPVGAGPDGLLAYVAPVTGPLSDVGPALFAAASTKKVTLIGTPAGGLGPTAGGAGFFVGGIYLLEPENGSLSKPATLTLSYAEGAARGQDPAGFCIYHYDPDARLWTPVECTHDRTARTLTAEVTEMGGYCVGSDAVAPEFTLLLPTGAPAVVTTSVPQLTVGCVETGSGLDPGTFAAGLDGDDLDGEWSAAAGCAVLIVKDPLQPGVHSLTVEGADGGGNRGAATFEIEVTMPPARPVLQLAEVTTDHVDLHLEPGKDEAAAATATHAIWRTDAGPGVSYRLLGTLAPGADAYTDADVRPGETYRYVAVALSQDDIEGPPSDALTVMVPPDSASDTTVATTVQTTAANTEAWGEIETTVDGAQEPEPNDEGLGGGTIAGIIIGCIAAVGLAAGGFLLARKKRRW